MILLFSFFQQNFSLAVSKYPQMASLSLTTLFAVLSWCTARASASNVSYSPALDPQLTSKFSDGDGPVLGYHGAEGVPSINTLSLIPDPFPALTYVSSKFSWIGSSSNKMLISLW